MPHGMHPIYVRPRTIAGSLAAVATSIILMSLLLACATGTPRLETTAPPATLQLTSTAFTEGGSIPAKYTCDGENVSPPLAWGEPPAGTASFALICDDPDAPVGIFTHWVIFNIPASARGLEEGIPAQERLSSGALQGKNGFFKTGYGGPCPPKGSPHHYQFTIYALDTVLDLKPGASKNDLLEAAKGHILARGQLIGVYQR